MNGEVRLALQHLETNIGACSEAARVLHVKIGSSLTPTDAKPGVDGRAHPEMSDLAATIYDYADRVEHVIVRLIDMSERCEL